MKQLDLTALVHHVRVAAYQFAQSSAVDESDIVKVQKDSSFASPDQVADDVTQLAGPVA
jgi:hypothetical protein